MLQIRLSKPANESGGVANWLPPETVTVACPDHLVIAELPVAKSLGTVNPASLPKTVGRRSRRQLAERVHFCVCCDFPIAVYGRLSPCEHIFCLDCARSDSLCYLCDERIQKIQTIKMLEGVYICAAPHCLKSFLKKTEFESHIHETHSDLLRAEKDGNISESASARKPTASESTVQAPPRPIFSPGSGSQAHDPEDKAHHSQTRDQQLPRPFMQQKSPFTGSIQNQPLEQQSDSNPPPGFERPGMQNWLPQQGFDAQGSFPVHMPQPHGFAVPMSSNPGKMNFPENYPRPWNMGQSAGQSNLPLPLSANRGLEGGQSSNSMDTRDSKGILMSQPISLPPPPPLPHQRSQLQRGGRHYSGDTSHDGQGYYGWQHEKRDNFRSNQD
ncbi:hypothetical protein AABB24_035136 [Solanum stoloniferum]|uniref:RING-type E3 ubiquitin transferase n=1 Tax=Solanum stoloniferum TaxID=62892 RepID=A0ABD2R8T7_9SOLN